jgi:hypothetical protein
VAAAPSPRDLPLHPDLGPPAGASCRRPLRADGSIAPCERWLNAVETFFPAPTRRRLRRGVSRSIVELQAAIDRDIAERHDDPKPFTWTKTADPISAKLNHLNASGH